jgi:hypothetical protein
MLNSNCCPTGTEANFDFVPCLVRSDGAAKALGRLEDEYVWQGVRAFDANNMLIRASDYDELLRGAVVRVSFTLKRDVCCVDDIRTDTFTAEIHEMCVIGQ